MKTVCKNTHGLLASGTCPWCEQPILHGQLQPDLPAQAAAIRRWNTSAMLEALAHKDLEVRAAVVDNLLLHGPKAEEALPVLRQALTNSERRVCWSGSHALAKLGKELSREEAEQFEQESQRHPDDCALHLLLLGYYLLRATMFEAARQARQRHVLWVIEYAPGTVLGGFRGLDLSPSVDGEAYEQAKRLWLKRLASDETDLSILHGATRFFATHDRELSEELFQKGQRLEPDNPEWSD
jgi:hypothetical protein